MGSSALSHCASYPSTLQPPLGHFARTVPRGLGRGKGDGDTVLTFHECAHNVTLDVAAEILGLSAPILPHNTRSEMSLPIRF
jgi:hypothetical protein